MISSGKLAVYEQMKKMERMERELAEVTVEEEERRRADREKKAEGEPGVEGAPKKNRRKTKERPDNGKTVDTELQPPPPDTEHLYQGLL